MHTNFINRSCESMTRGHVGAIVHVVHLAIKFFINISIKISYVNLVNDDSKISIFTFHTFQYEKEAPDPKPKIHDCR